MVAWITGAGRGIGLGIARRLAAEQHDIAVADIHEEAAVAEAMAELKQAGADVLYCRADVSDAKARAALLEEIRKRFGRLHVLVNNAGVAPKVRADILEATEESYEWVMKINLQGPYFLTQAAARWMVAQKKADASFRGCIVNISSVSAAVASTSRGEYCISKAGVSMATRLWAVRLAEFGIPVYEVRPGIIQTDMTSAVREKYDRLIEDGLTPIKRWGRPEDIGRAVVAIAQGLLPFSTGEVINVDGGFHLRRL